MTKPKTKPIHGLSPCVCDERFQAMKQRFRDVGDCLTDLQLLELADCYHEILRWRRSLRSRHPILAPKERSARDAVETSPKAVADAR